MYFSHSCVAATVNTQAFKIPEMSHAATIRSDSDESVSSSEIQYEQSFDQVDILSPTYEYCDKLHGRDQDERQVYSESNFSQIHLRNKSEDILRIQENNFYESSEESESDYDGVNTINEMTLRTFNHSSHSNVISNIVNALDSEKLKDKELHFFNSLNHHAEDYLSDAEYVLFLQSRENTNINELLRNIETQRQALNSGKNPSHARSMLDGNLKSLYATLQSLQVYYRNDNEKMKKIQKKFDQWERKKSEYTEKMKKIESNAEYKEKIKTLTSERQLVELEIVDLEEKLRNSKERKSIIDNELDNTRSTIEIEKAKYQIFYDGIEDIENNAIERLVEEDIVTLDLSIPLSQTNVVDNIKNAFRKITFESIMMDEKQLNLRNSRIVLEQISHHCKKSKDLRKHYKTEFQSFKSKMDGCRKVFEDLAVNERKIMNLMNENNGASVDMMQIEELLESSIKVINQKIQSIHNIESSNNAIFEKIFKNELNSLLNSLKLVNPRNKSLSQFTIEPLGILNHENSSTDDNDSSLEITENAIYHSAKGKYKYGRYTSQSKDAKSHIPYFADDLNSNSSSYMTKLKGNKIKSE